MKYLSVLVLLFVIGCGNIPTSLEPDEPAISEIYSKKTYIHEASGMVFPTSVESFKRTNLFRYDKDARNFSADYQWKSALGLQAVVKVYIYPAAIVSHNSQPDMQLHFDETKATLRDIYSDANDFADGTIKIGQSRGGEEGMAVSFKHKFPKFFKKQPCLSNMYLFSHGQWYIKYRVTYPEKNQVKADKEVGKFMHLLAWPEIN